MGALPPGRHDPKLRKDPEFFEFEHEVAPGNVATTAGDRTASRTIVVVAVAVGLGVLWLVSGLGSGAVDRVAPAREEAAPEVVLVVPTPVATPTPTATPVPTPTPTPDTRFIDSRAAQTMRTQLSNLGPSYTVVYATEGGLAGLRLSTSESSVLAVPPDDGLGLPDDATQFGLGIEDVSLLLRLAASNLVATGFDGGTVALNDPPDSGIILLDAATGQPIIEYSVAPGAELTGIDGYGVVAYVEGEGSYVAQKSGLVLLTEGELMHGNDVAWIERRCAEVCEVRVVDRASSEARVLPETFIVPGDRYVLSPNARFVLRVTQEGFGELIEPSTGSIQLAASEGMRDAAWSPDSLFLAWIDTRGEPELRLLLPERRDLVVVRLDLLRAPQPAPGEVRVLIGTE